MINLVNLRDFLTILFKEEFKINTKRKTKRGTSSTIYLLV